MNNIGALYPYGNGVARDYARAQRRYEKAALAGHVIAMKNIG